MHSKIAYFFDIREYSEPCIPYGKWLLPCWNKDPEKNKVLLVEKINRVVTSPCDPTKQRRSRSSSCCKLPFVLGSRPLETRLRPTNGIKWSWLRGLTSHLTFPAWYLGSASIRQKQVQVTSTPY